MSHLCRNLGETAMQADIDAAKEERDKGMSSAGTFVMSCLNYFPIAQKLVEELQDRLREASTLQDESEVIPFRRKIFT